LRSIAVIYPAYSIHRLFAGILSSKGAARVLLLLGESGHIQLFISEQVVTETERAIARKAPKAINIYRQMVLDSHMLIVNDPASDDVRENLHLIAHNVDVSIVLSAMHADVDFLVTLNRKHFIDDPKVGHLSGLQIGTPGDALAWVRSQLL